MTQYKSKKTQLDKNSKDMGLFIYPTLMAADILLYNANVVPVGADQRQHIEITRDLGERFNKVYGDTFTLPEYYIPKVGAKIMNLQKNDEKMNKSAPINDKGTIFILDDIKITRKKIMSATTDSENKIYFDEDNKPGISNLISIISAISNEDINTICLKYKNYSYKDFKMEVANIVCNFIEDIQEKYKHIREDNAKLNKILNTGAKKAKIVASVNYNIVRNKVGISI